MVPDGLDSKPFGMPYIQKPIGVSLFKDELCMVPMNWAEKRGNVVFYRLHDKGGHFATLERPKELWADIEEFVGMVVKGRE